MIFKTKENRHNIRQLTYFELQARAVLNWKHISIGTRQENQNILDKSGFLRSVYANDNWCTETYEGEFSFDIHTSTPEELIAWHLSEIRNICGNQVVSCNIKILPTTDGISIVYNEDLDKQIENKEIFIVDK